MGIGLALVLSACGGLPPPLPPVDRPLAPPDLADREPVVEALHGVDVPDPYRWLEDGDDPRVQAWVAQRNAAFDDATDPLPQRAWLEGRLKHLWRYDDETVARPCLVGERSIYRTRAADQDKWVVHLRTGAGTERVVLDPNTWEATETLASFAPSPDCSLAVYGVARAGDEDPVLRVLDLDTLEVLPDSFRGWRQGGVSWEADSSGLYYAARPLEGEVPSDEHFYWHRSWHHELGTDAAADELVAFDPSVKETYNSARVSEDGRWLVVGRSTFNANALWLTDLEGDGEPVRVTDELDAEFGADVVGDQLVLVTDLDAPRYRVMSASVSDPAREGWIELIAEHETDVLQSVAAIGGKLYATYLHDAQTRIAVYELDGTYLRDVPLPGIGSARVSGLASRPEVWVEFESFARPPTTYRYDVDADRLDAVRSPSVPVEAALIDAIEVSQVRYPSRDGTEITMFVIQQRGQARDGSTPFLLTGYGGFNISRLPRFSTTLLTWIEAGGGVAIPNLRGGGEYGQAWHEAGMREHKQNVFDDFLAAAAWLEAEGYAGRERLAIAGGSNGGLLVAAAVTQEPERFRAVLCQVPLTDMVRFHRFGLANIWSEEYGSAEEPSQLPYLFAYSPYHHTARGTDYPAVLVTGSANDARTDPAHARKFMAALRYADADFGMEEPILLHQQTDSGHGGGVGVDVRADQLGRHYGFLMAQVGLEPPAASR